MNEKRLENEILQHRCVVPTHGRRQYGKLLCEMRLLASDFFFQRLFVQQNTVMMAMRNRISSKYDIYINLMCSLSQKSDRCHMRMEFICCVDLLRMQLFDLIKL